MSLPDELRDLADGPGAPISAALRAIAERVEEQTAALEAAESALDHARRVTDPETARVLGLVQSRAQRALMAA